MARRSVVLDMVGNSPPPARVENATLTEIFQRCIDVRVEVTNNLPGVIHFRLCVEFVAVDRRLKQRDHLQVKAAIGKCQVLRKYVAATRLFRRVLCQLLSCARLTRLVALTLPTAIDSGQSGDTCSAKCGTKAVASSCTEFLKIGSRQAQLSTTSASK